MHSFGGSTERISGIVSPLTRPHIHASRPQSNAATHEEFISASRRVHHPLDELQHVQPVQRVHPALIVESAADYLGPLLEASGGGRWVPRLVSPRATGGGERGGQGVIGLVGP